MVHRLSLLALLTALPATAVASPGYHPFAPKRKGVRTVDLSAQGRARAGASEISARRGYPEAPSFGQLDSIAAEAGEQATARGDVEPRGSVVVPPPIAAGQLADPDVMHAVEDIPGYEYPRKHTLYLNYTGGMLYSGGDNSAESRSQLAKQGEYPAFNGGEAKAVAAAQETANDVAAFGVNVVYLERPPKILPYTMVMIGGSWTDTNLEDPAGGVAPGTDCGALGQRHVVYTFASGGWSAAEIANVNSQEAGHAWGMDHSLNCNSVMSYCGVGNGIFSPTCDGLCEAPCSDIAGCRLFHEDFCGVGSDQQNEAEELTFIFGGNEPDLEPPQVEILSPADGAVVEEGGDVDLRAIVSDNYGGYAWRFEIIHEGEVVYDEIDYDREVDTNYQAALNLVSLMPGEYSITVEIADHYNPFVTDTVNFTVEGEVVPADTGSVDESGSGGAGGSGSGGPTFTSGDEPTTTVSMTGGTAFDDDGNDKGCACRASGQPQGAGWALLGLCGLWRLRSRRRRIFRRC